MQGEDTRTALVVFGHHLVDSHGQARPDTNRNETREIIQILVSKCPLCGPGHMTSLQCRIRTSGMTAEFLINVLSCREVRLLDRLMNLVLVIYS